MRQAWGSWPSRPLSAQLILALASKFAGAQKNCVQHRLREPTREGVLLAWVIAAQKRPLAHYRFSSVAEARLRPWFRLSEPRQGSQHSVPREAAQRNNRAAVIQQGQLALQIGQALIALRWRRSICRWCTPHYRRHINIRQVQSIGTVRAMRLVREASAMQCRK